MSKEHIIRFYRFLDENEQIREEAFALRERFSDQARLLEEFVNLARREQFDFTVQEYVAFLYEQAE